MVDLQDLRNEIDSIDRQMTELFEKRMEISRKVEKYKISTGKKVFDKEREKKVIEKAKSILLVTFCAARWICFSSVSFSNTSIGS